MKAATNHHYRADIDGLRALAITLVVIYHAFSSVLPNGYVGVDVFFVVSGFLITGIILKDIERRRFSFLDFYSRRINRIFPALTVMLGFVLIVGHRGLLTTEYSALGKHVAAGAGFVSNFALLKEAGYFDAASETKPLLHLWSLAIEEQFYIFWPLLLVFVSRFRRGLGAVVFALILLSFIMNVARIQNHQASVFFSPRSRFWEIGLGALFYLWSRRWTEIAPVLRNWMSGIGLVLILASLFVIPSAARFPGWWALWPTLGTGLIILGGERASVNRLLGLPPLASFGKLSYPLYLWHWPLLTFALLDQERQTPSVAYRVGMVALAVVLAGLSYHFVEAPFRGLSEKRRHRSALGLLLVMVLIGVMGWVVYRGGIQAHASRFNLDRVVEAFDDWGFPGAMRSETGPRGTRIFIQGEKSRQTLFLGDSNMQQYFPRIEAREKMPTTTRSAIFVTSGACMPVPDVRTESGQGCREMMLDAVDIASRASVDTVVIGADWLSYFTRRNFVQTPSGEVALSSEVGKDAVFLRLEKFLTGMRTSGKRVFLVLNIPVGLAFDPRHMIRRRLWAGEFEVRPEPFNLSTFKHEYADLRARLEKAANRSGARVLDPIPMMCQEERCLILTPDGRPTYKDVDHVRPFFVRENASFIDETL